MGLAVVTSSVYFFQFVYVYTVCVVVVFVTERLVNTLIVVFM